MNNSCGLREKKVRESEKDYEYNYLPQKCGLARYQVCRWVLVAILEQHSNKYIITFTSRN